jgi:hypothetical protein
MSQLTVFKHKIFTGNRGDFNRSFRGMFRTHCTKDILDVIDGTLVMPPPLEPLPSGNVLSAMDTKKSNSFFNMRREKAAERKELADRFLDANRMGLEKLNNMLAPCIYETYLNNKPAIQGDLKRTWDELAKCFGSVEAESLVVKNRDIKSAFAWLKDEANIKSGTFKALWMDMQLYCSMAGMPVDALGKTNDVPAHGPLILVFLEAAIKKGDKEWQKVHNDWVATTKKNTLVDCVAYMNSHDREENRKRKLDELLTEDDGGAAIKKIKKLQHQLNDQKKKYATLRTKLNSSGGTATDASANSPPKKPRLGPKDCLNCNTSGDHHTKDCPVDRCAFCQKESCGHKFWECKARLAARKKRFNQSDK